VDERAPSAYIARPSHAHAGTLRQRSWRPAQESHRISEAKPRAAGGEGLEAGISICLGRTFDLGLDFSEQSWIWGR
jgi:hypothetical protein